MRLLTSAAEISSEFDRLLEQYDKYYWAVAWAGAEFSQLTTLLKNKEKIRQIVVGLHFHQTHPSFIRAFVRNEKVRFRSDTAGVFHPKLFVFENGPNDWEICIGSANFTNSAFNRNSEVVCLIGSTNSNEDVLKDAKDCILRYWGRAEVFSELAFERYSNAWSERQQNLMDLENPFPIMKQFKSVTERSVIELDWTEYFLRLHETSNTVEARSRMIDAVQMIFAKGLAFNELEPDDRKRIAGLMTNEGDIDWGHFGRMNISLAFQGLVNQNDPRIAKALGFIPMQGLVEREHFEAFIQIFRKASDKINIAGATRLLAMKRPDQFVCIDGKNRPQLNDDFGYNKTFKPDYDNYWNKIIQPIRETEWFNSRRPLSVEQSKIWDGRVAFVDALYYEPN